MNDIKAIVRQIADKFHAQLTDQFTANANGTIANWQKVSAEKNISDPWFLWPSKSTAQSSYEYFHNQQLRHEISQYIEQAKDAVQHSIWSTPKTYVLKSDNDERIAKKAKDYADAAVAGFIAKMNAKFEGICEAKGNLTKVEANGSLGWNAIHFEFADGSSFDAKNNIVHKWSSKGRPFSQYPTTFHNVMFPGGVSMKQPSEAKVKKVFVAPPVKVIQLSGAMIYGGNKCGHDVYDSVSE